MEGSAARKKEVKKQREKKSSNFLFVTPASKGSFGSNMKTVKDLGGTKHWFRRERKNSMKSIKISAIERIPQRPPSPSNVQMEDFSSYPFPDGILWRILALAGPSNGNYRLVCKDWRRIMDSSVTKMEILPAGVGSEQFCMSDLERRHPCLVDVTCHGMTMGFATNLALISRITALNLRHTPVDDGMIACLAPLSNLRSLDVSGTRVSDEGLKVICATFPKIADLSLQGSRIREGAIPLLHSCQHLTSLVTGYTTLRSASQPINTTLRSLDLWSRYSRFDSFTSLATLTSLCVRGDVKATCDLQPLSCLERLHLRTVNFRRLEDFSFLTSLAPTLTHLHIGIGLKYGLSVHRALNQLSSMKKLRYLCLKSDMESPSLVDHMNVEFLASLPELTHLRLTKPLLWEEDFCRLVGLTKLTYLHLRGAHFPGGQLRTLGTLTNLEFLSLRETNICDEGVRHLSTLSKLRCLDVDDTATHLDTCRMYLKDLTGLTALYAPK
ncbi:hypothetical protein BSKO_09287 [Bryopsis sp. KO-2023]|nr:hypothetical protein BSKO_09287 [Bryopsis sp. KO-2023]